MGHMIGADVDDLRRLAAQFDQAADRLRAQAGQVSNGVRVSAWVGPVAVRFRADWDSTHSVALKNAAAELAESALSLRQNAKEQEAASASLSGNAGTSVVKAHAVQNAARHAAQGGGSKAIADASDFWDGVKDVYQRAAMGIDSAKLLKEAVEWAKPQWAKSLPWMAKAGKVLGKLGDVTAVIGAFDAGWQIGEGIATGDGFKVTDGVISAGFAVAGVALVACPPAALVVGGVGLAWGAAQLASGDVPVSKRVADFAVGTWNGAADLTNKATHAVADGAKALAEGASDTAKNIVNGAGDAVKNLFRPPKFKFGW
ncbi:MAG: hypothetical protein QM597_07445 [Aeromicrobium sp.]|uniref:hypothetical protein n=1 Tax=Aeromicrobium sp. TaxID=1871063 RepID=UPI0039E66D12